VSGLDDVILRLRERCRALEEVFGDEFVGLVLFGSWARGRLAWVAMLMC
jgi:predicted nucleotidyltransferase